MNLEVPFFPTECAFPGCDCPGEDPVCPDYEETALEPRLARVLRGEPELLERKIPRPVSIEPVLET